MPGASTLRQWGTLAMVVLWVGGLLLVLRIGQWFGRRDFNALLQRFHRGVCWLLGLRVRVSGAPAPGGGVFHVANHASYIDVFILGSITRGAFIAKADVAEWPVFGGLAAAGGTHFFRREPRDAAKQIEQVRAALAAGENLFLFPEGTSTYGVDVMPFKSSLFAGADAEGARIQPVTVAYSRYLGAPLAQDVRERFAWVIPAPFAPHLYELMSMAALDVDVIFHPPVRLADFADRKACAAHCRQRVAAGLAQALPSDAPAADAIGA